MFTRYLLFTFAILLSACSDSLITKVEIRKPQILVHPESIDFSNLIAGSETGEEYFSIINVGNDTLFLDTPILNDSLGRYSIQHDEVVQLEPGELLDVNIFYIPQTYETNSASIDVISNDENTPSIVVDIVGSGDAPVITLNPEGHDFGTISIGCDNELRLTIGNTGNLPLEISSVQQMVTQPIDINMFFGTLPDFPWIIDPGFELDIITSYTPSDIGPDSSLITIDSNDPLSPVVDFEEEGIGQVEQWVVDTYEQEEIPLLDVLWVIDNSGSMMPFQQAMSDNMSDFMNVFLAATPDFNMAFVTTDSYSFQGAGLIDSNTQNPELIAASTLSSIGTSGSGHEKGIEYSKKSTEYGPASPGNLFFREDATLVIIYVSDEPDHSTGGWANYTNFFTNLKDLAKLHLVSIVGDDPSGCSFSYGNYTRNVSYGAGYIDITNYFNGTIYSLCSTDWGMQMEDLADTVSKRRRFNLSEPDPIVDTIEVYINGQQDTTNWIYNSTENWIEFNGGTEPDPGNTIEIKYATWGCE